MPRDNKYFLKMLRGLRFVGQDNPSQAPMPLTNDGVAIVEPMMLFYAGKRSVKQCNVDGKEYKLIQDRQTKEWFIENLFTDDMLPISIFSSTEINAAKSLLKDLEDEMSDVLSCLKATRNFYAIY